MEWPRLDHAAKHIQELKPNVYLTAILVPYTKLGSQNTLHEPISNVLS